MSNFRVAFTEWARASLPDVDWSTAQVRLSLLLRCPIIESGTYLPYTTLDELLEAPGVQEVSGPFANTGTATVSGAATELDGITSISNGTEGFTYISDAPCFVRGLALSVDGTADDGALIGILQPPQPLYITGDADNPTQIFPQPGDAGAYLFAFLSELDNGSSNPQIGDVAAAVPSLHWEQARAAHVWLDPQRVNYAVNPSFEASGDDGKPFGWRSNSEITKERGGIKPPGFTQSRQFCARLSGEEPTKVLESQFFPTGLADSWWSVEAAVAGTGQVRLGIVFWPPHMAEEDTLYVCSGWFNLDSGQTHDPNADPEDDQIHQGQFRVIKALIPNPETTHEAQFRLEFETDADVWVDNVLVEPNEAQLGYFDGSWEFGQVGDFSWYTGMQGGVNVNAPHKTYSLFYNNRRSLREYLLDPVTTEEPPAHHVLAWVPEGAAVIAHWDDVFSTRIHSWIDDIYVPILDYTDRTVVTTVASEYTPEEA